MKFADIIGQEDIVLHLQNAVFMKKISHAYIINGEEDAGKLMLAEAFAATLLCEDTQDKDACEKCDQCHRLMHHNQPDVIYVTHEKDAISVDDIRQQVSGDVAIRPYQSDRKIYIIENAQKMNVQAQNALLKTIEEPPDYVVILLLTTNADAFLQTIVSRCVRLDLKPISHQMIRDYLMRKYQLPDYQAMLYAVFSQGNLGKAIKIATSADFNEKRQKVIELVTHVRDLFDYQLLDYAREYAKVADLGEYLDLLVVWYRDVLLYKSTLQEDSLAFRDASILVRRYAEESSYAGLNQVIDKIAYTRDCMKSNVRKDLILEELLRVMKEK